MEWVASDDFAMQLKLFIFIHILSDENVVIPSVPDKVYNLTFRIRGLKSLQILSQKTTRIKDFMYLWLQMPT